MANNMESHESESTTLLFGSISAPVEANGQSGNWGKYAAVAIVVVLAAYASSSFLGQSNTETVAMTASLKGGFDLLGGSKDVCYDGTYRDKTLQLAYELPFSALFKDTKGQKKYEASSVIMVDDSVYAICDSSWAISKFSDTLQPFGPENIQIGDPAREKEDSGYEAIFHDEGTFYVVRESIEMEKGSYHAIIEELDMGPTDYTVKAACPTEFEFEGTSKGFEGGIAVRDLNNQLVVLGLCEGNHCSEKSKKDRGHGRLVAMTRKTSDEDGTCEWQTLRVIRIPESADFADYSAITMNAKGRVAIASQEDSQIWIGNLLGQTPEGLWNIAEMEFAVDKKGKKAGPKFNFPKNDMCITVYCNIEGIHWINDEMLLAASDKMKSNQDFRCFEKDQSVHVFVLP